MNDRANIRIFGDFIELDEDRAGESLTLRFSPSSTPLQQRWRNNGLSADFLAGYVSTFLPVDNSDPASARKQADTAAAVGYVANELLENAMKYSAEGSGKSISMRLHLESRRIIFHQSNCAAPDRGAALENFIARLETLGASEMLIRQMEAGGDENGSGLGLLTMVNDYGARLAFRVVPCNEDGEMIITTQVELDA